MNTENETGSEVLETLTDTIGTVQVDADTNTVCGDTDDDSVIFIVEGEKISSSRSLLCYASPVFRTMLTKTGSAETKQIQLPGINLKAFRDFLECIDPVKLVQVTMDTVYGVLTLACEYQMIVLKNKCEDTILREVAGVVNSVSSNNKFIFYHLQLAEHYRLCRLTTYCINLASELTQRERETAAKIWAVSQTTVTKILTRAVRKLELSDGDEHYTVSKFDGKGTRLLLDVTDVIGDLIEPNYKVKKKTLTSTETKELTFQRHLRALRLAYKYDKSTDVKKKIVLQIRKNQNDPDWKTMVGDEFDLLNESIKNDIDGRMVPIF